MKIILGIDPGSLKTGFGIIATDGRKYNYVASGCIYLTAKTFAQRLRILFEELTIIIKTYNPERAAIEEVFVHANPNSALKLGQARGAAMVAITSNDILISEYSAREVKKAIVGYGAADKHQVQYMIRALLKLQKPIVEDEADALAIALYDANFL